MILTMMMFFFLIGEKGRGNDDESISLENNVWQMEHDVFCLLETDLRECHKCGIEKKKLKRLL
jgi:hypothetical protein